MCLAPGPNDTWELISLDYDPRDPANEGVMKEEKEPQAEPVEPKDEPKAAPKQKSNSFTVTDQGEHGYDIDGPFGIGMIKGK